MTRVRPAKEVRALCLSCMSVTSARYDVRVDGVHLVRDCSSCGLTEARVLQSPEVFYESLAAASRRAPRQRGLIAELLDGCNIECPTCIAGSGLLAGNVRPSGLLQARIRRALAAESFQAVLLSGGEPSIHPDFLELVSFISRLQVPARVVITNGLRFAEDPTFVDKFADAADGKVEVFLQWDTLRADALLDIRGADYSSYRVAALTELAERKVPTTLVSVVKRGVTLEFLAEVLDIARQVDNVVGVQFQPIRDAGRVENFERGDNSCDVADVLRYLPEGSRLAASPSSPWSAFLGWMDRGSGVVRPDVDSAFYITPTEAPSGAQVRVAVLDYSDRFNWTDERSRLAALAVLDQHGGTPSVDDYFLGLGTAHGAAASLD